MKVQLDETITLDVNGDRASVVVRLGNPHALTLAGSCATRDLPRAIDALHGGDSDAARAMRGERTFLSEPCTHEWERDTGRCKLCGHDGRTQGYAPAASSRPLPHFRSLIVRDVMTEIPVLLVTPQLAPLEDAKVLRRAGYSIDGCFPQVIVVDLNGSVVSHDPIEWRSRGNATLFALHYQLTIGRKVLADGVHEIDVAPWREQLIDEGVLG